MTAFVLLIIAVILAYIGSELKIIATHLVRPVTDFADDQPKPLIAPDEENHVQ